MNRVIIKTDSAGNISAYGSLTRLFEADPEADKVKSNIRYAIIKKNRPYRKDGMQIVRVTLNQANQNNGQPRCKDPGMKVKSIGVYFQRIDGKYINPYCEKEITTEMMMEYPHRVIETEGIIELTPAAWDKWING